MERFEWKPGSLSRFETLALGGSGSNIGRKARCQEFRGAGETPDCRQAGRRYPSQLGVAKSKDLANRADLFFGWNRVDKTH